MLGFDLMTAFLAAMFLVLLVSEATELTCDPIFFDCSSNGFQEASCPINAEAGCIVAGGNVAIKYSNSDCIEHQSFWIYSDNIVVNNGCRAKFELFFKDPCDGVDCNNGVCVNCMPESCPGNYYCDCDFGYTGDHCDEDVYFLCVCKGDPHISTFDFSVFDYQGSSTFDNIKFDYKRSSTFDNIKFDYKRSSEFDNNKFHYQGSCEYLMATDDCDDNVIWNFKIYADFWHRGLQITHVSWVKSLQIELNIDGNVWVLTCDGMGLKVKWNGDRTLKIGLKASEYVNDTCGLCGVLNGYQPDDFTMGSACDSTGGAECLSSFDDLTVQFEYEACVEDICLGGDDVCDMIIPLVEACCDNGFLIEDWGQWNYCKPVCGVNMILKINEPTYTMTCHEVLYEVTSDPILCTVECYCREGYYYDETNETCVLDCGCLYTMPDGTIVVVPDGTVIITDPCATYTVCDANSWVTYNPNCDDDVTCEVVNDVFTWECPENTVDVYSNCMDCKDPCSGVNCGQGTCVVNDGCSYSCECEDCWYGDNCEIDCADKYGGKWKTLNVTISPSCYFFCGKEKNFAKAEARCEKKGGKMVTIETQAEDNMIYEEIKDGDHHWTGLQITHEPPSPIFYWYAYPDREVRLCYVKYTSIIM
ncbi:hypothetical protein ScPMuIL_018857 [Solemya velum]